MIRYCLTTPTEDALDMLKFIVKHNLLTTKEQLMRLIDWGAPHLPGTLLALDSGSAPTVQYLMDEKLLPEHVVNDLRLADLQNVPKLRSFKELIEKYQKDQKKQKKK